MRGFAAEIGQFQDCEAVLEYAYALCRDRGAVGISYHFTPIFESPTSRNTFIWARGVPSDYQLEYFGGGYREIDPVPRFTFDFGHILTWQKAIQIAEGRGEAEEFFTFLKEHQIENWAGFALYGPRNRDAFAALIFRDDPESFDEGQLERFHTLLQSAHLRICQIIDSSEPEVALSAREREVLIWMGRGKSSGTIARILKISPETVKTYVKRIYEKLEASDRVTATVRALKLGLIEL